jgi:hypothetical protein
MDAYVLKFPNQSDYNEDKFRLTGNIAPMGSEVDGVPLEQGSVNPKATHILNNSPVVPFGETEEYPDTDDEVEEFQNEVNFKMK